MGLRRRRSLCLYICSAHGTSMYTHVCVSVCAPFVHGNAESGARLVEEALLILVVLFAQSRAVPRENRMHILKIFNIRTSRRERHARCLESRADRRPGVKESPNEEREELTFNSLFITKMSRTETRCTLHVVHRIQRGHQHGAYSMPHEDLADVNIFGRSFEFHCALRPAAHTDYLKNTACYRNFF